MTVSLIPSQEDYSDLELSTQVVIKEALARQIKVEILDRDKCVIRLTKGSKTEYIQQATRTSIDSQRFIFIRHTKVLSLSTYQFGRCFLFNTESTEEHRGTQRISL